ncbi:MAG: ATP-binding cassette domain-containing protein, partial [Lachnospiraceae bacterium]|nr:ATP-binding cassette domain-containing protein [Lachnospiraceae bacterium]
AGKTTLTKMLTGIIAPTSGRIHVMGFYPNDLKNEFKRQYAVVMGQKSQLFFELTANDTLRLFKEIYELDEKQFRETRAYFTELFNVRELMDMQVRTLSLGERMKMELMVALLHNPRILFLDEPSIGLDAIASNQIRRFLKQVNRERGTSIILTSHYMEDIATLCDRSVVIHHGCKVYDGRTDALFARYQKNKKITATFSQELPPAQGPAAENPAPLQGQAGGQSSRQLPCWEVLERTPHKLTVLVPKEEAGAALAAIMPWGPTDISVEEDEIGTVVERIYQEGAKGVAL